MLYDTIIRVYRYKKERPIPVEFFKLVAEVGFPIASSLAGGYFVFLTLKFILC